MQGTKWFDWLGYIWWSWITCLQLWVTTTTTTCIVSAVHCSAIPWVACSCGLWASHAMTHAFPTVTLTIDDRVVLYNLCFDSTSLCKPWSNNVMKWVMNNLSWSYYDNTLGDDIYPLLLTCSVRWHHNMFLCDNQLWANAKHTSN